VPASQANPKAELRLRQARGERSVGYADPALIKITSWLLGLSNLPLSHETRPSEGQRKRKSGLTQAAAEMHLCCGGELWSLAREELQLERDL
jgi:hypothetical protein